jgi:hypothetical protein
MNQLVLGSFTIEDVLVMAANAGGENGFETF